MVKFVKRSSTSQVWLCMPLIRYSGGRGSGFLCALGQPFPHSEFQSSQEYTERSSFKNKQPSKMRSMIWCFGKTRGALQLHWIVFTQPRTRAYSQSLLSAMCTRDSLLVGAQCYHQESGIQMVERAQWLRMGPAFAEGLSFILSPYIRQLTTTHKPNSRGIWYTWTQRVPVHTRTYLHIDI